MERKNHRFRSHGQKISSVTHHWTLQQHLIGSAGGSLIANKPPIQISDELAVEENFGREFVALQVPETCIKALVVSGMLDILL